MKTIIIEDEYIAAQSLQELLHEIDPSIEALAVLQSVEDFSLNQPPDLAFFDINLADGSSFSIFEKTAVACPVIFTTAYDEYALKAFEVKSIDYLLKPIERKTLERALAKFREFTYKPQYDPNLITDLVASMKASKARSKTNILTPHKDKLLPLSVEKIAFIHFEYKIANVYTFDGKSFPLDKSLDELHKQLDADKFFRANRQYIISRKAIKDMALWFGRKLSVNLSVDVPEKVIISKARVSEFKEWFTM